MLLKLFVHVIWVNYGVYRELRRQHGGEWLVMVSVHLYSHTTGHCLGSEIGLFLSVHLYPFKQQHTFRRASTEL